MLGRGVEWRSSKENGMLKLGLERGGRATFGEQYSFGFVNVYSKFPFGEISV